MNAIEQRHGDLLSIFFSRAPEAERLAADLELRALVAAYPSLRTPLPQPDSEGAFGEVVEAKQLSFV